MTEQELKDLEESRTNLHIALDIGLAALIASLSKEVYAMYQELINGLQFYSNGFLLNNASNRNIRSKESKILEKYNIKETLTRNVEKGFGLLGRSAESYFKKDDPDSKNAKKKRKRLRDDTYSRLLSQYGLNQTTSLLDEIMSPDEVYRKARLRILNGVLTNQKRTDVISSINDLIVKDKTLQKHYHTSIQDIYSQFDRDLHEKIAVGTGYKYAIYQGGLISTSRKFCKVRNRKVFTIEEIRKFGTSADKFGGYSGGNGKFVGKNKNYNPLRDAGGHNCRHFYSYISEKLAYRLRPSLKPQNLN